MGGGGMTFRKAPPELAERFAERQAELAGMGATQFEPMPGRPMRGFLIVPPSLVADDEALIPWLERARAHVLSLPPKPGR